MGKITPHSNGGKPAIDLAQLATEIAEIRARLYAIEHVQGNHAQSLEFVNAFIDRIETWIAQHSNATERMEVLIAQGSVIVEAYNAQQQGGS